MAVTEEEVTRDPIDERPRPWRRRVRRVVGVLVGLLLVAALTVWFVDLPGKPSKRSLDRLADKINATCAPNVFGEAHVNLGLWAVDVPSGTPTDLSPDELDGVGNGPKVGCGVQGAIR